MLDSIQRCSSCSFSSGAARVVEIESFRGISSFNKSVKETLFSPAELLTFNV